MKMICFCLVGGMNYLVDLTVFNLLRLTIWGTSPLRAKVVAVMVATLFSWVVNRCWTFAGQRTDSPGKELLGFVVVNLLGMLPALLCLGVSHYLLHLTSLLADNISGNVIGLILGTILRYFCYQKFVFTGKSTVSK